jgi:uncharacterized protein YggT (Ycf19 family)
MDSRYSPTTRPLYFGTQVVWYVLGLIETLLVFRFVLKLLGANPESSFSVAMYSITHFLVAPFVTVFRVNLTESGAFEWTTILAMLVYYLLGIGIIKLLLMSRSVSTHEAAHNLSKQDA